MRKEGYIPLASIGLIFLILVVSVSAYYQWSEHRVKMNFVHGSAISSSTSSVVNNRKDMERQALEALYEALWRVGKIGDNYDGGSQKLAVERLWVKNLRERLSAIVASGENMSLPPWLKLGSGDLKAKLERENGGYPRARVELPEGTSIFGSLPDNSFFISLPCENIEVSADARFFLLEDRMSDFKGDLGEVELRWKFAEYALAYAQAWAGKEIKLSEERSRILFQLAWASHEIDKFGSADFPAVMEDISSFPYVEQILHGYDPDVVVKPLKKKDVQNLKRKIDLSLSQLRFSADRLGIVVSEIEEIFNFRPENWIKDMSSRFSDLYSEVGEKSDRYLRREFRRICENFSFIYRFPESQADKAVRALKAAEGALENSRNQFMSALDLMDRISEKNPLAQQLYEDFTRVGTPPGIVAQFKAGVGDVHREIDLLREKIWRLKESFFPPDNLEEKFPSNLPRRFESSLEEDNKELARKILSESSFLATESFNEFMAVNNYLVDFRDFYRELKNEYLAQLKAPKPNWENEYEDYPRPGENYERSPERKSVKKYVIYRGEGTIGGVENVLESVRSDLELLEDMARRFESERERLQKFELDEDLREKLEGEWNFHIPRTLTREETYELSPPEPLRWNPGLSVYHEVDIEDVSFDREDPAGWVGGDSAPPTPIYLWFINVTLYWAQWNVVVNLEEPLVEEIFDYRNQVIPRPIVEGSINYVHKALPNRQEFRRSEFSFRLIVLSLRPFGIS